MTDDRANNANSEHPSHTEGGSSSTDRDTTPDTALDANRTGGRSGGMGGMAGTRSDSVGVDTDMAGTAPSGALEDQ